MRFLITVIYYIKKSNNCVILAKYITIKIRERNKEGEYPRGKGASLLARGPRAEASRQSYVRDLQCSPALRRCPIPGPSARKNAVEVGYAWERRRDIKPILSALLPCQDY
jgi:hypothetical protein